MLQKCSGSCLVIFVICWMQNRTVIELFQISSYENLLIKLVLKFGYKGINFSKVWEYWVSLMITKKNNIIMMCSIIYDVAQNCLIQSFKFFFSPSNLKLNFGVRWTRNSVCLNHWLPLDFCRANIGEFCLLLERHEIIAFCFPLYLINFRLNWR